MAKYGSRMLRNGKETVRSPQSLGQKQRRAPWEVAVLVGVY